MTRGERIAEAFGVREDTRRARHTLRGRQDAAAVARARKGAIVLLFGDESEALTHPYLAHVWAKKGADLRVPAPGQASKSLACLRGRLGAS